MFGNIACDLKEQNVQLGTKENFLFTKESSVSNFIFSIFNNMNKLIGTKLSKNDLLFYHAN